MNPCRQFNLVQLFPLQGKLFPPNPLAWSTAPCQSPQTAMWSPFPYPAKPLHHWHYYIWRLYITNWLKVPQKLIQHIIGWLSFALSSAFISSIKLSTAFICLFQHAYPVLRCNLVPYFKNLYDLFCCTFRNPASLQSIPRLLKSSYTGTNFIIYPHTSQNILMRHNQHIHLGICQSNCSCKKDMFCYVFWISRAAILILWYFWIRFNIVNAFYLTFCLQRLIISILHP